MSAQVPAAGETADAVQATATLAPAGDFVGESVQSSAEAPVELVLGRLPRVDLMPAQLKAANKLARTQRLLAGGVLALVVAIGAGDAGAHAGGAAADQDLMRERARTSLLHTEQARYAEVNMINKQIDTLTSARAKALAGDVRWQDLVSAINADAPKGVWLDDITVHVSAQAIASGSPAPAVDPLAKPAVATLTFTGHGGSPNDVAAWLESLTEIPGLSDARYSASTRAVIGSTVVENFSSSVGITTAGLSHRYDDGED